MSKGAAGASSGKRSADGDEHTRLVDAFIESYVFWREQCVDVQSAYDRWISGREEGGVAFAMYHAELEFEERAARAYRDSAERLALATRPLAPSET
jgi:hypothetical protein